MRRSGCPRGRECFPETLSAEPCFYMCEVDDRLTRPTSSGGVWIYNAAGRIDVNNTFEERLKLLETDALPSMRVTLFGENDNRKFRD